MDDPFSNEFYKRRAKVRKEYAGEPVNATKGGVKRHFVGSQKGTRGKKARAQKSTQKRKHSVMINELDSLSRTEKPAKAVKTLSTKQDLERFFGKPLDEEANQFIDAGKQDLTVIPTIIEDAVMDMAHEIIDRPDDVVNTNHLLAKILRKRHHDEIYED